MDANLEKLIKLQGAVNKDMYHLHITVNIIDDTYEWILFKVLDSYEEYMSWTNRPIMSSDMHTMSELEIYLKQNNGFIKKLLSEE